MRNALRGSVHSCNDAEVLGRVVGCGRKVYLTGYAVPGSRRFPAVPGTGASTGSRRLWGPLKGVPSPGTGSLGVGEGWFSSLGREPRLAPLPTLWPSRGTGAQPGAQQQPGRRVERPDTFCEYRIFRTLGGPRGGRLEPCSAVTTKENERLRTMGPKKSAGTAAKPAAPLEVWLAVHGPGGDEILETYRSRAKAAIALAACGCRGTVAGPYVLAPKREATTPRRNRPENAAKGGGGRPLPPPKAPKAAKVPPRGRNRDSDKKRGKR
jgi:hypothetical protein